MKSVGHGVNSLNPKTEEAEAEVEPLSSRSSGVHGKTLSQEKRDVAKGGRMSCHMGVSSGATYVHLKGYCQTGTFSLTSAPERLQE